MKTIPFHLLDELLCPCCGSRFEVSSEVQSAREGLSDGILRCDCYEYPVVSGIAVLRQMSPVSSTQNEAVNRLKQGDSNGALLWLLGAGSAAGVPALAEFQAKREGKLRFLKKVRSLLRGNARPAFGNPSFLGTGYEAALRASRPRGYADYLFHRFANPSLLGAVSPIVVCGDGCRKGSDGRVLDLLCGVGHASAIFSALWPEMEIIAADSDFVNLFLAGHFVAPRAVTLCIDAELPLPFADSSVDGFFCLDGLHYVRSKRALLREVDRVANADGFWLFAHMHNAAGENENPGAPLSVSGYAARFGFGPHRLVSEHEVLRQFQTGGCLDLSLQPDLESMSTSHALTLVGSRTDSLWKRHSSLDGALCRRPDLLGFNPLYKVEKASDGLLLRSMWPSESLHRECAGNTSVLPETVHVPSAVVNEISLLRATGSMSDDVRKLLRSFVLVTLPECYPRTGSQV